MYHVIGFSKSYEMFRELQTCVSDFPLTKSIRSNVLFIESDHTMHIHVSILHAVVFLLYMVKCHLCLVILDMQECIFIRLVNDQWQ